MASDGCAPVSILIPSYRVMRCDAMRQPDTGRVGLAALDESVSIEPT